jgi:hypothetical protein
MSCAFERGGLNATADGNIIVLAGSCVGGGSTINWSASFETPTHIVQEWADGGLSDFRSGGKFSQSMQAVVCKFGVSTRYSHRQTDDSVPNGCCGGNTDTGVGGGNTCDSAFAVNENNRLLWKV